MRVEVWFDVSRNCWAVHDKQTGLGTDYVQAVMLADCRFKVKEREDQKVGVIEGDLVRSSFCEEQAKLCLTAVTCDPKRFDYFFIKGHEDVPVHYAPVVWLGRGCYAEVD
jgi:hypothetical protein